MFMANIGQRMEEDAIQVAEWKTEGILACVLLLLAGCWFAPEGDNNNIRVTSMLCAGPWACPWKWTYNANPAKQVFLGRGR